MAFKSHKKSSCHREAVDMVITLPSTTTPIGTLLSRQHAQEMATNRKMFLKILACMKFLARQGLPFRGHDDDSEGNFSQILKHHAKEEADLSDWLQRKNNKYTSHEIQNKLIQIMAHQVLRDLASKIQNSKFICIMIDETNDITNKEQVTIVIRSINEELEVSEDFLGLYIVSSIDASSLFSVVSDVLTRLNLSWSRLRGQCYDGCSTMSGHRNGLAKRVHEMEPRAVFTHCYSHSLNLAANDSVKKSKFMKGSLETASEITKLIKLSPRRDAIFEELKSDHDLMTGSKSPAICLLCPTRWTVRADSMLSILKNYKVLLDTLDEAC